MIEIFFFDSDYRSNVRSSILIIGKEIESTIKPLEYLNESWLSPKGKKFFETFFCSKIFVRSSICSGTNHHSRRWWWWSSSSWWVTYCSHSNSISDSGSNGSTPTLCPTDSSCAPTTATNNFGSVSLTINLIVN